MKTKSDTELLTLIRDYAKLQCDLISCLPQEHPEAFSGEDLFKCPCQGMLVYKGEKWNFRHHGVGICFENENSGKTIDALTHVKEYPSSFDSFRLEVYFDSLSITKIEISSVCYDLEETILKKCLDNFTILGLIKTVSKGLYCLASEAD